MNKKNLLLLGLILLGGIITCSCNGAKDKNAEKKAEKSETVQKVKPVAGKTIHITKAEFLQKIANFETNSTEWKYLGDKPCIVDFYADWCGPCKMIAPILDNFAKEYKDDIYIYKVNVDKEKELARVFNIKSIPTILFVPQTGKPQLMVGGLPKEVFKDKIDNFLLKK